MDLGLCEREKSDIQRVEKYRRITVFFKGIWQFVREIAIFYAVFYAVFLIV